jgi:hypothetical protein
MDKEKQAALAAPVFLQPVLALNLILLPEAAEGLWAAAAAAAAETHPHS